MQRSISGKGLQRQTGGKPACARRLRSLPVLAVIRDSTPAPEPLRTDPDEPLRRYGSLYGKTYTLESPMAWIEEAPRVRIRSVEDRMLDELLELAVLNERLSGSSGLQPWRIRARLERIKMKRRNWEAIYHYITQTDAVATLDLIEELNAKVEESLSDDRQSRSSVSSLQKKLLELQQEVNAASEKLAATQARVEQNLQRVNELKAEAAALERLRQAAGMLDGSGSDSDGGVMIPSASLTASSSSQWSSSRQSEAVAASASAARLQAAAADRASGVASTSYGGSSRQQQEFSGARPSGANALAAKRGRGLHSSLEMEDALRNFWYPAEFSKVLEKDTLVPFEIFGESWVLFRDEKGQPACIKDTCAHRACPLSLGKVVDGEVQCAYHGWQFNGDGSCTKMPSTAFSRNVSVASLPCAEKDGFIWVWPGDGAPPEVPDMTAPPPGFTVHAEIMVDVPVEHGLLVENLLDLAHAPFTHTSTFARGWPIPDVVRFHATKMMSGYWDPYPINMSFQPPCMTVSMIGLAQPGKIMRGVRADQCERHLHQLHVCMPSKRGHTRLLYRMSMDFMGWVRYVPGIQAFWKQIAAQVLGEDLVLVKGQQDRLQRGNDTWANPVPYDKLGVRYRRWRNTVASGDMEGGRAIASSASMSAGQLFSPEDPIDEKEGAQQLQSAQQV